MDIVVILKIRKDSKVDRDLLKQALDVLVRAVHPNVKAVGFSNEEPLENGSSAVQIRTPLDHDTKHEVVRWLKRLFNEAFDVSDGESSHPLKRRREISKAARQFAKTIN
jgi:hypothetical protein